MSETMIKVATSFSKLPCVRRKKDGPYSGEEFRVDRLLPAFAESERVVVDLEGCLALGSSFLDEAFAGLIRYHGFTYMQLKNRLEIRFSVKSYIDEAWKFMKEARSV